LLYSWFGCAHLSGAGRHFFATHLVQFSHGSQDLLLLVVVSSEQINVEVPVEGGSDSHNRVRVGQHCPCRFVGTLNSISNISLIADTGTEGSFIHHPLGSAGGIKVTCRYVFAVLQDTITSLGWTWHTDIAKLGIWSIFLAVPTLISPRKTPGTGTVFPVPVAGVSSGRKGVCVARDHRTSLFLHPVAVVVHGESTLHCSGFGVLPADGTVLPLDVPPTHSSFFLQCIFLKYIRWFRRFGWSWSLSGLWS